MTVVLSNLFKAKLTTIEDRLYRWGISPYIIEDTIDRIERTQKFSILEFLVFENILLNSGELARLGKYVGEEYFIHKNEMPNKADCYVYTNSLSLRKLEVYIYDYTDWDFMIQLIRNHN
jgi:hypothetical protein